MKLSRLLFFAAFALAAGALSFTAQADEYGVEYPQLLESIRKAQSHCSDSNGCELLGIESKVLFSSHASEKFLSETQMARLKEIAFDQSQIWADTILEGDYESDGQTRLDLVVGLFHGETLIGYRITYSERGWYIGDCSYDYEDKASLKGCQEGRIKESSFVSPAMTAWMRDEHDYAEFYD